MFMFKSLCDGHSFVRQAILYINRSFANSGYADLTPGSAEHEQGLHCLHVSPKQVFSLERVKRKLTPL